MFELIDFLIVNPIINILLVIYNYIGDFGVAMIVFTLIVKFLTWPLVKKQFVQMKLMRKIQPELTEIRKRCNGNKQLETIQMMDLYKRNNVKPLTSIWTLFIQLPIFFALFFSIRIMVTPTVKDNVSKRAYPVVSEMTRIDEIINLQNTYLENTSERTYDFKPQLFGKVDLSVRAGLTSLSSLIILLFALGSAFTQYYMSKMQMPKKSAKNTWKKMVEDAKAGKDMDQADLNNMVSGQMSFMMPAMMLMITINLPGALVMYYLLSNLVTILQQKIVFNQVDEKLDDNTDRAILRALKKKTSDIKEAEVIENKKTGTRITRISAKDAKKSSNDSSLKQKSSSNSTQPDNG